MENFGKTNQLLSADYEVLSETANNISSSGLTINTNLIAGNLTETVGENGDVFIEDASLFMKMDNFWYELPVYKLSL